MRVYIQTGLAFVTAIMMSSSASAGPGPVGMGAGPNGGTPVIGALYSFEHNFGFDPTNSHSAPVGFVVDFSTKKLADVSTSMGLHAVGEFAVNHYDGFTPFSVRGGARFVFTPHGRLTPFAQVEGGLWHCGVCEESLFTLMMGGGADIEMPGQAFRVRVQFDVPLIFDAVETGIRISAGVSIPIGKK